MSASDNPPSRKESHGTLKLLPCPFCGAEPTMQRWHGGGPEKRIISCGDVRFDERCHVGPGVTGESPEEAADRWNARSGSVLPADMTPAIAEVLGLQIFRTAPLGHLYRASGEAIRPKVEEEQAFVLFRFLHLALQHGSGWFAASCADVEAARNAAAAKLPTEDLT